MTAPVPPAPELVVVRAGLQDLVVDGCPRHALRFGLVEGGPLDPWALRRGNLLLGNPPAAAGLECVGRGPTLRAERGPIRLTLTGGFSAIADGRVWPAGRPLTLRPGAEVRLDASPPGLRGWLAVAGGLAVPAVFGSRSADRPGGLPGLAGRPLAPGDRLPVGPAPVGAAVAGDPPPPPRLGAAGPGTVRVLRGPQWEWVAPAARAHLLGRRFVVSPSSDRAGLRLLGPPLPDSAGRAVSGTMASEATTFGAVQLTPEGLPLILLADRGSLGGYPKPLQVIAADLGWLAQARPGTSIGFRLTTRAAAWRALARALGAGGGGGGGAGTQAADGPPGS